MNKKSKTISCNLTESKIIILQFLEWFVVCDEVLHKLIISNVFHVLEWGCHRNNGVEEKTSFGKEQGAAGPQGKKNQTDERKRNGIG